MAEISAKDVKALRDLTGAGMMDAKRALVEADGDAEKAQQLLVEKGLAKAAARTDRDNAEGVVALAVSDGKAAVVQLKCETDFTAKSDDFVKASQRLAEAVLADGEGAVDSLSDAIDQLKLSTKENIEVGKALRFEAADGNVIDTYLHVQDGRGTTAVVIEASGTDPELLHEVALHIAFAKPTALSRDEIAAEEVEKARASFEGVTRAEGKPEQAVPKIVEGRLNAWFADQVLPDQGMFGEKETVQQRIGDGSIVRFALVAVGS